MSALITLVTMRITAGTNEWRKVEEVKGDRHISRKLEGNVLNSCRLYEYTRDDGTSGDTTGGGPCLRKKKPGN